MTSQLHVNPEWMLGTLTELRNCIAADNAEGVGPLVAALYDHVHVAVMEGRRRRAFALAQAFLEDPEPWR